MYVGSRWHFTVAKNDVYHNSIPKSFVIIASPYMSKEMRYSTSNNIRNVSERECAYYVCENKKGVANSSLMVRLMKFKLDG